MPRGRYYFELGFIDSEGHVRSKKYVDRQISMRYIVPTAQLLVLVLGTVFGLRGDRV